MFIRSIAFSVIAALLMTGGAVMVDQVTEYDTQPMETAITETLISQEEATAIALEHAGLTESRVTGLRVEYDREREHPEWEIDFRSGDWEYDYEIHAETGAVIKGEKEYDPEKTARTAKPAPTESKPTEPAPTQPAETETISADKAKEIALNHAGLEAGQVNGLRAEYDVDDGVTEWEVEFYADGMEYDYEIHAETGKILSWDKERED